MTNGYLYPPDWKELAEACKKRDGYQCRRCQVKQYTVIVPSLDALVVVVDPTVDHPKMIYLHAAHVNHDRDNPRPELETMCPSCHGAYDYAHRVREAAVALERFRHCVKLARRGLLRWYQCGGREVKA